MDRRRKRKRAPKVKSCSICGRLLRDPRSVELGVGPTCRLKYNGGEQRELEKQGQLRLFE